ncbi:hypothetical protein TNCV_2935901 [Trichonephila clavipes]|nr:hypothetical protein TNCV_2935901 [Trichonephila clavipes]
MAFVRDTERLWKDSNQAAHLLRRKRQKGFIRGCEEGKGRHCSKKRVERLWARGCLMPLNGKRSGASRKSAPNSTVSLSKKSCLGMFSPVVCLYKIQAFMPAKSRILKKKLGEAICKT